MDALQSITMKSIADNDITFWAILMTQSITMKSIADNDITQPWIFGNPNLFPSIDFKGIAAPNIYLMIFLLYLLSWITWTLLTLAFDSNMPLDP